MLIKTSSIEYDRRLKKEIKSILEYGFKSVNVFAIEDQQSTYTRERVNVYNPEFFFRKYKFKLFKLLTFFELLIRLTFKFNFKTHDKIWVHDPLMILVIPFLRIQSQQGIIWDLHELPSDRLIDKKIYCFLFRKISSFCETIIVANDERGQYLVERNLITSYKVLYNYPEEKKINFAGYSDGKFKDWVKEKDFVYCQSATHPGRNFLSLAEACVNKKQYLVVLGEKNSEYYKAKNSITDFDDYIFVMGKKPSDKLDYYISKAKYSFVFYAGDTMNNYLCAPNRLYNSLKFGIPVVVGENLTMKNLIEMNKCGVVVDGFGESAISIGKSIKEMNKEYDFYKKNAEKISGNFRWENQSDIIKNILSTQ